MNEIYSIKTYCPKTCLDPFGTADCGEIKPVEGCFCKEGFVLNSNGVCVPIDQCGCPLPDGSGILAVN